MAGRGGIGAFFVVFAKALDHHRALFIETDHVNARALAAEFEYRFVENANG